MSLSVYPRNLYTELHRRWTAPPLDRFPRIELPEKRVFDELVDVCYHASFTTEEGRPIMFRVALIGANRPVSPDREEPLPLEPIERYLLGQAVPFTEGELRRLAPVADLGASSSPWSLRAKARNCGFTASSMSAWRCGKWRGMSGSAASPRPRSLLCLRLGPGSCSSPAATGRCCGCAEEKSKRQLTGCCSVAPLGGSSPRHQTS